MNNLLQISGHKYYIFTRKIWRVVEITLELLVRVWIRNSVYFTCFPSDYFTTKAILSYHVSKSYENLHFPFVAVKRISDGFITRNEKYWSSTRLLQITFKTLWFIFLTCQFIQLLKSFIINSRYLFTNTFRNSPFKSNKTITYSGKWNHQKEDRGQLNSS